MDRFSKLHPVLHFTYFICVFVLCVSLSNPLFSLPILVSGIAYNFVVDGKNGFGVLKFIPVIILIVSVFNFIFAHYGITVLFTFKQMNFTLEALFYGFYQGITVSSMLVWFGIFSKVTDSEKVIYFFKFAPKCALIFSMILGFIPRFKNKLEDIRVARLGLNGGEKADTKKQKIIDGINDLSALVTYSLESSIITADSMKARGYNPKAVRYSRYKLKPFDLILCILILFAFSYIIYTKFSGRITFIMNPSIYVKSFDIISFILCCVFGFVPVIVDLSEEIRWKLSAVKK